VTDANPRTEHAARIVPPGEFRPQSFRRKRIAPGVTLVLAKRPRSSATETQAIRFDAAQFSPAEARAWLERQGYHAIAFEAANDSSRSPANPDGDTIAGAPVELALEAGRRMVRLMQFLSGELYPKTPGLRGRWIEAAVALLEAAQLVVRASVRDDARELLEVARFRVRTAIGHLPELGPARTFGNEGDGNPRRRRRRNTTRLGPGKFSTAIDRLLYSASLEGWCDNEAGDVSEVGRWYGLIRFSTDRSDVDRLRQDFGEDFAALDAEDRDDLEGAVGAIVWEDSQGFAGADLYYSDADLAAAWQDAQRETEPAGDDDNPAPADNPAEGNPIDLDERAAIAQAHATGQHAAIVEAGGRRFVFRGGARRYTRAAFRDEARKFARGRGGRVRVVRYFPGRVQRNVDNPRTPAGVRALEAREAQLEDNPRELVQIGYARQLDLSDGRRFKWRVSDRWPVLTDAGAEQLEPGRARLFLVAPDSRRPAEPEAGERAARTFETWHGFDPRGVYALDVPALSEFGPSIGDAVSIVYRSDKWEGRPVDYVHEFKGENPPKVTLVGTPEAPRAMVLRGGAFRVTRRGLVQ
jgi:hypothetical protein